MVPETLTAPESDHKQEPRRRRIWIWVVLGIFIAAGMILVGIALTGGTTQPPPARPSTASKARSRPKDAAALAKRNETLRKALAGLGPGPKEIYIVVDTAANRLTLRQGDKILHEAVVSSGSGNVLEDPTTGRKWVFDTPQGAREVRGKITDPDWIKPDWAFVEEGKPLPKNQQDRVEVGVLGDYALSLGDGYLLHGTLYKRLLGRNVTHGCVRLGDEDLKKVYDTAKIGTKVFLF